MKVFPLADLAASQGGEYVLGERDLGSPACYLVYGTLAPGEGGRVARAGAGYEEILCAITGPLLLQTTKGPIRLERGQAIRLVGAETAYLSNPADVEVIYVMAGGESREEPAPDRC